MICPECNGKGKVKYYREVDRDAQSVTIYGYLDICHTCHGSGIKVQSNADHIRSMTDEELAEYLYDRVGVAAEHIAYCENNPECELMLEADVDIPDAMCKECLCRWLKQPYKEAT